MKYQLIKPVNTNYSAIKQILTNRGVKYEDLEHYCNTTDNDINSPLLFGEEVLKNAVSALVECIRFNLDAAIIVDSDCDGFTSSALFINYLYDLWPTWVNDHLTWYLHEGKQHGLNDIYNNLIKNKYSLVVTPDSSSNDYIYHEQLNKNNAKIIVLDHHDAEKVSPYAIVINNQLSDYPNKQLSGVGVTWQFCRYIDSLLNEHFSNNYLDLVALGLTGDMQSLLSLETKHLINKGFKTENIHNPFIYYMWEKNKFKLGDEITPWGATFYIVPLVNAITRSATMEEKKIVFQSMLNYKAFELISSTKRGHQGEDETIVEQAIRICTNVKNRQTKAISEAEELLNKKIVEEDLLKNKVLLLLLQPNCIDKNIAG